MVDVDEDVREEHKDEEAPESAGVYIRPHLVGLQFVLEVVEALAALLLVRSEDCLTLLLHLVLLQMV